MSGKQKNSIASKKPKKNGSKPKRLSTETWEEIKFKWCTDSKYTFAILSKEYSVPEITIKIRSHKEKWKEFRRQARLEASRRTQERTIKILEELKLPKKAFLKLIVDCAKDTKKPYNIKQIIKPKTKGGRPTILEKTIEITDQYMTWKYRDLICKLAGWYAPPKAAIKETLETPESDRLQEAELQADEMTPEEAERIYVDRVKSGKR